MTPEQLMTWPLPIGKHKATFLHQVPFDYLKVLSKDKGVTNKYPEIKEYVDYIERTNSAKEFKEKLENELLNIGRCQKITYATESIAKAALQTIKSKEQKHKKPYRAYECPDCGGWHLTSKEDINWLKKQIP
jgi:hypothetical protein